MKKIIIDCDPGIDDSLALIYAIKSEKFDIIGITTVSGNVPSDEGAYNVCRILNFLNVKIPVYVGGKSCSYFDAKDTHGENGLGNYDIPCDDFSLIQNTDAVSFMTTAVKQNKDEVTILALGPLTNIYHAIRKYDYFNNTFLKDVHEIISMGGAFRVPGNCSPVTEYNYWCDPSSAHRVFKELPTDKIKFTMLGLDVTRPIILDHYKLSTICFLNPKLGELVKGITKFYFEFHKKQEGIDGCVINDPVVIFYMLHPESLTVKPYYTQVLEMLTSNMIRGMVVVDENNFYKKPANVNVATNIAVHDFWFSFIPTIIKNNF